MGEIFSLKQRDNYEINKYEQPEKDVLQVIIAGFENEKAMEIVDKMIEISGDVLELYRTIYNKMASNPIGGKLILYRMDLDTLNKEKYILPIEEPGNIVYQEMTYGAFVDSGASTAIKAYMGSAVDISKNAILSSGNQAITIDDSGIRLRKNKHDGSGYEPEQIAMINNNIVFTSDSWSTASMAIGTFKDSNMGDMVGICAPSIVGTLVAGENFIFENQDENGNVKNFRFDSTGAMLYNATFDIVNEDYQIAFDPSLGMAMGKYPVYTLDDDGNRTCKSDNAVFWLDIKTGDAYFGGELKGATGTFSGELKAAGGTFSGVVDASTIV